MQKHRKHGGNTSNNINLDLIEYWSKEESPIMRKPKL
jgi:hypothetical protein